MIKTHFNKRKYDYLCVAVILAAVTLMLSWIYGWNKIDMQAPLYYGGGDEMSGFVNAKLFEVQDSNFETDRLGAPYGAAWYDFPASLMHNFDLLTLKICVFLTGDAILGSNLNIYLMFYLAALISYAVMRELSVKRYLSVLGSIAFAFTPFVQSRMSGHTQLAEAYFIPLSVLMCIWLYERDDIFCLNKQFFKNPRNYFMILFIVLIGNNGIAYYPFFTCFMLMVTAVAKWIKTHKFAGGFKCVVAVLGIGLMIIVNILPYVFYVRENGSVAAASRDDIVQAETYSMKVVQLFMPMNSSGNKYVAQMIEEYNSSAPLVNENVTSYLGSLGVAGFVILLFVFMTSGKKQELPRLRFLSQLDIFLVLLAAGSGIGTMFAFFVTPLIRGYNRASVVIVYVSLLGLCIFLSGLGQRWNKYVRTSVLTALMCFGIWEQSMPYRGPMYNVDNYYSDRNFIEAIEDSVESGSMIFTLPYHQYPEGGAVNRMPQDALFTGMIFSDNLKWSYGGVKGRPGDLYCAEVAALPVEDMVERLKKDGFSGIYIDRRAYGDDERQALEAQLKACIGADCIVSGNGNLSFYKFQ